MNPHTFNLIDSASGWRHTMSRRRTRRTVSMLLTSALLASCGSDGSDSSRPNDDGTVTVEAAGTHFAVQVRGRGPDLLLIHGAGEDASMLEPLATELAASGRRVISYDRRGTGGSGREEWPGGGAGQHADDAAAILGALDIEEAEVVGFSSGGVIALDLAVRHPDVVAKTFIWEAPALGVVPGADEINAAIMAPIEEHLAEHPGDYVGAQAMLLTAILGFPVSPDDPAFAGARRNAEAMIRDEPAIPPRTFTEQELAGLDVTIAIGTAPNDIVAAAGEALSRLTGTKAQIVATDDHEVYLNDPATIAPMIVREP